MKPKLRLPWPGAIATLIFGWAVGGAVASGSALAEPSGTSSLPEEAETALQRGLMATEIEEWELAVEHLGQAQEAAPRSPRVLYNYALACDRAGGRDLLAMACFHAYLVAVDPESRKADKVRIRIGQLEERVEKTVQDIVAAAREIAILDQAGFKQDQTWAMIAEAQAATGDLRGARETAHNFSSSLTWKQTVLHK